MPVYATWQDYVRFYGEQEAVEQTNLEDPAATQINTEVLDSVLLSASAEIDGHLAVRYALPVPEPFPAMLAEIAATIARKNLDRYTRREHVQQDYKDAIDRLRRIAKGEEALLGAEGAALSKAPSSTSLGSVSYRPGEATFTRRNLGGYGSSWW